MEVVGYAIVLLQLTYVVACGDCGFSQRSASGRGPIVSLSALDDDVSAEARAVLSNEIPHNCPIVVRQLRKVTR